MFFLTGKEISSQYSYWKEGASTRMISSSFSVFSSSKWKKNEDSYKDVFEFVIVCILQYEKNFKDSFSILCIRILMGIPQIEYTQGTKSNRRFLE